MSDYNFTSQIQLTPFGTARATISTPPAERDESSDNKKNLTRILRGNTATEFVTSFSIDENQESDD